MSFSGHTALVTGAASGIGRCIAMTLAQAGARVAAVDKDRAGLESLLESPSRASDLRGYECDVGDARSVGATVRRIEGELGSVDFLVNVAGVLHIGTALQMTQAEWDESLRVNTSAVVSVCRTVAAGMIRRRSGAIVIVASNAALVPRLNMCAYSVSKAATLMFARCLALELAEHDVRCNTVSPGSTATPMLSKLAGESDYERSSIEGNPAQFRLGIPLRRIADVEDISSAVSFLLSPAARHITMQNITVDGGASLGF